MAQTVPQPFALSAPDTAQDGGLSYTDLGLF